MIEDLLIQTAEISRWSNREPSADFTINPSWSVVASGVPCNVQEKSGSLARGDSGQNVSYTAVGYFLYGTDIKPTAADRSLGDRLTVDGKVYQVIAVMDQTGRQEFLKAFLVSV